ncbi:MAG: heavy-metal-associated domain-containing protein [Pseudomonadales bacterium]|nr:heavy-metal-associated domain-containing protein [Pseudomonadales bacterium]
MLNFLKKKRETGEKVTFTIKGMHCTSCSMNIDGELEDTLGVISATTSYAKAQTVVEFVPSIVSRDDLKKVIENLDYTVQS